MQPKDPQITPAEYEEAISLARGLAYRIGMTPCIREELHSIGLHAVMVAAGKFVREKGVAFAGYARNWIVRDIYRGLRELKSPVTHSWNASHDFEKVDIVEMAEIIPAKGAEESQEKLKAGEALERLAPEDRALLWAYYVDGNSIQDIRDKQAGRGCRSVTTVAKRLKAARERYQKAFHDVE